MSWNVQGCGHWRFVLAARQVLRDSKPDLVVFVEPRISVRKADFVIASLGFPNSYRVEAIDFSGRIWLAWYDSISVEILPQLRRLAANIRSPWVLFGDFNATLSIDDRNGCIQAPSKAFQHLLLDFGLRDMGYQGPDFTWSRRIAQARLDRFICNRYWDKTYHISIISYLLHIRSDHRPILLQVENSRAHHSSSQFRYFLGWLSHKDFHRMVADNWHPKATMTETLTNFTKATDVWNKLVFGYIGGKKRMIMAQVRGIQKSLCSRPSHFLSSLESELLLELENLLAKKSFCGDKSRVPTRLLRMTAIHATFIDGPFSANRRTELHPLDYPMPIGVMMIKHFNKRQPVPTIGPLSERLQPEALLFPVINFSDFMDGNGNWDRGLDHQQFVLLGSTIRERTYKIDNYIDVKVNDAVHKGMPHKFYHCCTDRVWNVTKLAFDIESLYWLRSSELTIVGGKRRRHAIWMRLYLVLGV
ncbi:hypothetical protein V6N13_039871 [Hibiscus sabdariffa]